MPVLRDTHNLHSDVGALVVAGGAVAEFASIALLGVLFAVPAESAVQELLFVAIGLLVLVLFVLVTEAIGWGLRRAAAWTPGRSVATRLDLTTSQIRTRGPEMDLDACFERLESAFASAFIAAMTDS